ncbi:MAG: L-serine ammonia-lyase, iron-sulfur-dependent, subunit alpha [Lachnospiraceae bacterium]|nr:L-serine ammonia-lyase, iron-sulfur-dependent, subunit alpha [Lachnospiraceae bacterium]
MYHSLKELLQQAEDREVLLSEIVLDNEIELSGMEREKILQKLEERYEVMKRAAVRALGERLETAGNLISGIAMQHREYTAKGTTLCGEFMNLAMAMALSGSEVNASMGRICAAPTAGACGIVPAVLISIEQAKNCSEKAMLNALLTASGIGTVIMKNATVAGAEGGCQAECGVAAAMAAAAGVELCGGTPRQSVWAAVLALVDCMGLVCDPVAGLVQVPCAQRNASQTVNALTCIDLALAGMTLPVTPDEVVESMYKVGRMLPPQLRETAQGGIAATKSAQEITKRIFS